MGNTGVDASLINAKGFGGNNGTALNHVYYTMPKSIGRTTGFESYTPYVKQIDEQKYYDTKSPFIDLYVGLGGKGRSLVDFEFSRNINAQWNIGFDIKKISSNKLVGSASLREPQVSSTTADIYTFYSAKLLLTIKTKIGNVALILP